MRRSLLVAVVTLASATAHAKPVPAPTPVPNSWIGAFDPDRVAHPSDSTAPSRPEQVYAASYVPPGELSAWPHVVAIAASDAPLLIEAYRTPYDRVPRRREPGWKAVGPDIEY